MKLICPLNPSHALFEKHYFEFYDSSDFVDSTDRLVETESVRIDEVERKIYAARILHCVRCAECNKLGDEWDESDYQLFQKQFANQVGRELKETEYVTKIMDIVEGFDDNEE